MYFLTLVASALTFALPPAERAPECSVGGHGVAIAKAELPPEVLREIEYGTADVGEPFNKTDALRPGEPVRPSMRLICGYRTLTGYVVEREQGGRAYSIGKVAFHKTETGYAADRPPPR